VPPEASLAGSVLDVHAERLQTAESVDEIVRRIRDAVSGAPGVGGGAVFLLQSLGELAHVATIEGREARLSVPEIELAGVAQRALREKATVRQDGSCGAPVWAQPIESPQGMEGVVAAVGEIGETPRFLAHAGLALFRERRRRDEAARIHEAEARVVSLERALEVLDDLVREGGSDTVVRRIASGIGGVPGIGRTSVWTLRAEDGCYVEVVRSEGGRGAPEIPDRLVIPDNAHRAEGFREWAATLPRWGGFAWIPRGAIQSLRPGAGDALLLPLAAHEARHPLGFLLAEVERPLDDPAILEDLQRWVSIGRHALESRAGEGRGVESLDDLREEKEKLTEVHRLKAQFIATVSHELRTPLTSISAYAETLRTPTLKTDAETRDRFLRVIFDESRRLTRIVDDILDLATMDAGRVRMSCRKVDLVAVVRDALDVIRPLATQKEIALRGPLSGEEASLHGDPDLLKQLVVNLLENAVKFTGRGGNVSVDVEREHSAVRLVVEDDGPGIPVEKLDLIFERFYQIDGTNARSHGGSGLGLAICRSIATWHDGRIWAESEPGKGARFKVSLPRLRATSRSRASEPTVVTAAREGTGIPELLIEMISEVMCAEAVSLMLLDPSGHELFVQAAMGLPDEAIREARVAVGQNIAGAVAATGEALHIPDLDQDPRFSPSRRPGQYRTRSLLAVPVKLRGSVIGVINVTNKTTGEAFDAHDKRLLEILAQRVALVLNKLREFGDSRDAMRRMEDAMRGVIDVRRHYYPSGHRFSNLVLRVCQELGVADDEAARIHYASILRDVGMTRLPEGVYKKPADLTEEDKKLVHGHPEEGARVLRSIEFLPDVFDIILAHHEEPDGSGYPRGLLDPGIPKGAKILAVVDAYHALRTGRPYRAAVDRSTAIHEIRRHAGRQFDAEVVEALVRVLEQGEEGSGRERREPPNARVGE
jgi:signal transduction histidine kinase/HD-GYP domain-containing protein (c-di-GMP phosphodiesterase class II)